MDRQEIWERIQDAGVQVVRLWFTDILGRIKGFNLNLSELDRALEEGIGFDGSSVEGFVRIEESDLIAKPDPDTLVIFPDDLGGVPSAVFMCDIQYPDGRPYESDPRYVLRRNLEKAHQMGFEYYTGPELEYFYFPSDQEAKPLDAGGYFDVFPMDRATLARKEALLTLNQMGITVEASHHEVAYSQHELDFRYQPALRMADYLQIARAVVKEKARKYGLYATFMPKPVQGINGSGLHVHQSLFRGKENAFYSETGAYNLSEVAAGFIAGLLRHAREITAVTNQWVNSYKRLVVGYEAPVYITWGRRNRSALVRVPAFKPHKSQSCRIEYRAPDPATNPYLAFAVMLAAGLKGVEERYPLPDPVEEDIFAMPEEVKARYGIDALPDSLYAAIQVMAESTLVRETLGDELFEKYLRNKKTEWERYRVAVTDYELKTYLPTL